MTEMTDEELRKHVVELRAGLDSPVIFRKLIGVTSQAQKQKERKAKKFEELKSLI